MLGNVTTGTASPRLVARLAYAMRARALVALSLLVAAAVWTLLLSTWSHVSSSGDGVASAGQALSGRAHASQGSSWPPHGSSRAKLQQSAAWLVALDRAGSTQEQSPRETTPAIYVLEHGARTTTGPTHPDCERPRR